MNLNTQGGVHIPMGTEELCGTVCDSRAGGSKAPWTPEQLPFQLRRVPSPRPGALPKPGGTSQQLRKEGRSQIPAWEREQAGALGGGDKLWRRTQTFCQKEKLPRSLQELLAGSFPRCLQANTHRDTHPLPTGALLKAAAV